ncbi:type I-F CRISPR-associated endoribonuclease Cas6/Csy4 [Thiorhodococcus mannitoliphagus]|uniref:Type I-F CRISPR-associated endoribonuclease Cas6/Csy4 n=1 Tax=Thiorhodococcus mannitoliphagus TaxID=329406 RepID=A0A6P1E3I7_9GAMM|nr:type I-F CRISPR-associated endoribonuclease Cas6/Csy4 [Thiorhodococcus mannitoliphagus]NEX23062.1 type I-F CRISPR-associated endoribonuclease Cas6/Csy4 [Thiorhodococcus mannitoliphagus]
MRDYIDIHLRPDPEFPAYQLMAALYAKLHRVLAQVQSNTIGVSFPGYRESPPTLGNRLRLLGPEADLSRLMEHPWLKGMRDHTEVARIAQVPVNAEHRSLRRVQAKSSPERLRRRQMRRHGLTEQQARERVPDLAAEMLQLPFVTLASVSTGQSFRLFLRLGPPTAAQAGPFNTYGLSCTATTPWF